MMRFFIAAVSFAQLLSCLTLAKIPPLSPDILLGCDDPEAEAAAMVAVNYINAHHRHGYTYALDRIENIKVSSRTPDREIHSLEVELDLLETKCHALMPTPIQGCPVRPRAEHAVEGDCDVKLIKVDGSYTVHSHSCKSEPDSAEDVASACPDCPLLAPMNDTRVVQGVDTLLHQMNSAEDKPHYQLHEIGRARIWTLPEHAVELEFVVAATNCSTQDAKSAPDSCVRLTGDDAQFAFCVGTVKTTEDNTVNCTSFKPQSATSGPSPAHPHPKGQPAVAGSGHHHLPHLKEASSSGESSSSEMKVPTAAAPSATPSAAPSAAPSEAPTEAPPEAPTAAPSAAANLIVKRSIEEKAVLLLPRCPGKKRFI